jgi:hypothetical protein
LYHRPERIGLGPLGISPRTRRLSVLAGEAGFLSWDFPVAIPISETTQSMKLAEILRAVDEGLMVHWQNQSYEVVPSSKARSYLIRCQATGHCIGLTQADGATLNGKEKDFFIGESSLT